MGTVRDTWGFAEGDAITPDLTAMRLLGGRPTRPTSPSTTSPTHPWW